MAEKQEIWKKIDEFPNYEVSDKGRVKSLNWNNTGKEKVLIPFWNSDNGYLQLTLCKDGKQKLFLIHRLVATTFIPNPENKRTVNHINGNKTDNRVENLEWNTDSENMIHSFRVLKNKNIGGLPKQKVRCIETNQEFESQVSASKCFGCNVGLIHQSIHKGYRCKGFHFELIE